MPVSALALACTKYGILAATESWRGQNYTLGRTLDCQAHSKPIQPKILIGVSIKTPARFIVSDGSLATM
jgi:hypothetical protein